MTSTAVLASAILSSLTLLIDGALLFLILSRGRQKYHYLFAATITAFAIGTIGILLVAIRGIFINEMPIYISLAMASTSLSVPCIYHFTCSYLNQPRKKSTIFIWAFAAASSALNIFGVVSGMGPLTVVTGADRGTFWTHPSAGMYLIPFLIFFVTDLVFILLACWFLFRAHQRETSPLVRRHKMYILISFLVIAFFYLTLFLMPTKLEANSLISPIRGLIQAAFGALVATAIIKERLLDITVIIKKTTIYSILLAIVIFIFSLSEHLLAKYVGEFFGEHSIVIHIISIAVVIAILIPVRQRIERAIERSFARKKVEF
jgi:hypothetical protein